MTAEPMETVKVCDMLTGCAGLEPRSVSLIIADPPYFRVKGDFDKAWESREDYLADVDRWAAALERVLAWNGTLVWWCSDKMEGEMRRLLDARFSYLNSCTVVKDNGIQATFANLEQRTRFLVNDERFLVYACQGAEACEDAPAVKARNRLKFAEGTCRTRVMESLIAYLEGELEAAGLTVKDVDRELGTCMGGHWFKRTSQWQLPTKEQYERLRELFRRRGADRPLRREYEGLRRPFDLHGRRQSDVFHVRVDSGVAKRLGHPTVKDWKLTLLLVETMTRPGDLVLAPFAGSGTECAAALELGAQALGFEIDPRYAEIANARCARHAAAPPLIAR